jgi:hypothetical protein
VKNGCPRKQKTRSKKIGPKKKKKKGRKKSLERVKGEKDKRKWKYNKEGEQWF